MDKESVLLDSEDRMDKALGALDRDFSRLRTGRASTGLVDNIKVDYYGTPTPISQLASVAIPDSRTITIQPWDRGAFASVEKAILKSDLGLTPVNDGKIIRLVFPQLTEERRKELVKQVKKMAEDAKVAVRNIRRDGMEALKKLKNDKAISEDEHAGAEKELFRAVRQLRADGGTVTGGEKQLHLRAGYGNIASAQGCGTASALSRIFLIDAPERRTKWRKRDIFCVRQRACWLW